MHEERLRFRQREVVKEITYRDKVDKGDVPLNYNSDFYLATKPNYLHRHPFLIQSNSHRTLDAENIIKKIA